MPPLVKHAARIPARPRMPWAAMAIVVACRTPAAADPCIPPMILHGPASTSANPSATFYVDAWPRTIIYQWSRGTQPLSDGPTESGSFISGATTSELTILRVQPSDIGEYSVTVSTDCGKVTSDPATLRLCPGDFTSDAAVDETDFIFFAHNYNIMDCAAPAMPTNCPGDLNSDTIIDDADFTIFVVAYDAFLCP